MKMICKIDNDIDQSFPCSLFPVPTLTFFVTDGPDTLTTRMLPGPSPAFCAELQVSFHPSYVVTFLAVCPCLLPIQSQGLVLPSPFPWN